MRLQKLSSHPAIFILGYGAARVPFDGIVWFEEITLKFHLQHGGNLFQPQCASETLLLFLMHQLFMWQPSVGNFTQRQKSSIQLVLWSNSNISRCSLSDLSIIITVINSNWHSTNITTFSYLRSNYCLVCEAWTCKAVIHNDPSLIWDVRCNSIPPVYDKNNNKCIHGHLWLYGQFKKKSSQWRYNKCNGVPNHRRLNCVV